MTLIEVHTVSNCVVTDSGSADTTDSEPPIGDD